MAYLVLHPQLERLLVGPLPVVQGDTVAEAFKPLFAAHPQLASVVVDETGGLRRPWTVFVNGQPIADRQHLRDWAPPGAQLLIAPSPAEP